MEIGNIKCIGENRNNMDNQTNAGNGSATTQDPDPIVLDDTSSINWKEEIEKKDELIKSLKSLQAGETRKVGELAEEVKALRGSLEERLSATERAEYEEKKLKDSNLKMSSRLEELENINKAREARDFKLKILKDNDLADMDLVDIIAGESVEAFLNNVLAYKTRTTNIEQTVKTNLVNGRTPQAGTSTPGAKELNRADFDALSLDGQRKVIADGTKII